MANLIQIKRSLTTSTPSSLANGELAYTANGDVLFIGSNGNVEAVGGKRTPGTLTANQALVANSTSGIDKVIVANLVPTQVYANGSLGSEGQVLTSNGSAVFWTEPFSGSITNLTAGDGLVSNATGIHVLANSGIIANSTGTFVDDASLSIATSQLTGDVALGTQTSGNYVATITAGAGISGSSSTEGGTPTIAVVPNTGIIANSTGVYVNSSYISTISANNATYLNGQLASYYTNASNITTGTLAWAQAPTGTVNTSGSFTFSGIETFNGNVVVNAGLIANGGIGSAGQVLHSDGSSVYWATDDQGVTQVSTGNGLSGGPITTTGTIAVVANSGIISNTSGVFADGANGIFVTSAGINVVGGTGVTVNATGVHIGQEVGTSSNVTFANVVTTDLTVSNAATFDGDVEIGGDLTVTGNVTTVSVTDLIVEDPLIHLASNNETSDVVDIGFVGHYSDDGGSTKKHVGLFRDASDGIFKLFTGSQDATLDAANSVVINTSATGYTTATLEAYLKSGGLVSNSSVVNITANSTLSVALTANTLSLTSALPGTSGGTGLSSYTSQDLLVANSTNGFTALGVGSEGYVLQVSSGTVSWGTLDGGTF